jgi:hypothetical protein
MDQEMALIDAIINILSQGIEAEHMVVCPQDGEKLQPDTPTYFIDSWAFTSNLGEIDLGNTNTILCDLESQGHDLNNFVRESCIQACDFLQRECIERDRSGETATELHPAFA